MTRMRYLIIFLGTLLFNIAVLAESSNTNQVVEQPAALTATINTLSSLLSQKAVIDGDIAELSAELKKASSDTEKDEIKVDLDSKGDEARKIARSIENLAANTDLSPLRAVKEEAFNFQKEIFSLLEPTLKEMRHMTDGVRTKANLRDRIAFIEERIPVAQTALENINRLEGTPNNALLSAHIKKLQKRWSQQLQGYQTELSSTTLQLDQFEADEKRRDANDPGFFKTFFKKRGWVLLKALSAILLVILISKTIHHFFTRFIKGYRKENRSVRLRIIDLLHRTITIIFIILAPMVVFYLSEDWVLFTLSIMLLIGIAWSLREAIPKYWQQIEIFLNIGSVREGERLVMDDIPWEVKNINIFSTLHNPRADLTKRVKLGDLTGLNSRPVGKGEPWFPCEKGDWVILSDGVRGRVIGISLELVELIQRGGARCTYTLSNFLAASPQNLSLNFRLKELLGISYDNQQSVTREAPARLREYLEKRILDDGHQDILLNLNVEFEKANDSSLDLVVIADFKGEAADRYNRLRRAIQRYCVDASTEFEWEIPFPQMTFHNPLSV